MMDRDDTAKKKKRETIIRKKDIYIIYIITCTCTCVIALSILSILSNLSKNELTILTILTISHNRKVAMAQKREIKINVKKASRGNFFNLQFSILNIFLYLCTELCARTIA